MRDFSWKYFTLTGDVDAYMLYMEMNQLADSTDRNEQSEEADTDGSETN